MLLDLIVQPIFEFVLDVVCYYIGRAVVPIASFGRVKCDWFEEGAPRRSLWAGGWFHRRGQQTYLTAEATIGAGLLFVGLVAVGISLAFLL